MSKLVSIHQIGFSVTDNVPPAHVFIATDDEQEFLFERGAARKYNAESDKTLPVYERPGASVVATTLPDVSKANKTKLQEIAAAEQVPDLTGEETVDQLRAAILANRESKEENLV